jgi:hypothetical protein
MTPAEATIDPVVLREKLAHIDLMLAQNNLSHTHMDHLASRVSAQVPEAAIVQALDEIPARLLQVLENDAAFVEIAQTLLTARAAKCGGAQSMSAPGMDSVRFTARAAPAMSHR